MKTSLPPAGEIRYTTARFLGLNLSLSQWSRVTSMMWRDRTGIWIILGYLLLGHGVASGGELGTPLSAAVPLEEEPPSTYLDPIPESQTVNLGVASGRPSLAYDGWTWQVLPDGLLYPAYLAGGRESRFASQWVHEKDKNGLWDIALGGRTGILRFGADTPRGPEGWQVDIEGAAFPRLTLDDRRELVSADFRFGIPLTYRQGVFEGKFGYYHISSHMGDEWMVRNNSLYRINYTRDALVLGLAARPHEDLRIYGEAGWAFYTRGGSEPWEFQWGIDYSPARPSHRIPQPFFAVNGRIREEVDFGGNLTAQAGLQWRGHFGQLFRTGLYYFHGKTDQYEFFREHEEHIGFGVWYDF